MKKLFIIAITLLTLCPLVVNAEAKNDVTIYFFRGLTCQHCEEALNFINNNKEQLGDIKLVTYEVWKNQNNATLQSQVADKLQASEDDKESVPFIVIGETYIVGMLPTQSELTKLLNIAKSYQESDNYRDVVWETLQESDIKVKSMSIDEIFEGPSKTANIVVFVVFGLIILGFAGMVIFSRR